MKFLQSMCACVLLLALLSACAQPGNTSLRVQLRTVNDWSDLDAVARRAAQVAGMPVRDTAGVAPRWFALTLVCPNADSCEQGLRRLKAAQDFVTDAFPDERRSIPPFRPSASTPIH